MVEGSQVARGKRIQRRTGKTFHVATRLLPEDIRHPTYVLYGFFRIADEVVDAEDPAPPPEQRAELDRLRRAALGEEPTDDPVLDAFASVRAERGIADADVNAFVDAMESDIDADRYETYADLEAYMDGSAAAVGRMMTAIMDLDEEAEATALPHATKLGEAFQMTNFLRDVREDVVERDRIYIPLTTLRRHGVSEEQILNLEFDENVAAAIRAELARTERLYETGVAGIKYLPEECQLAVLLAAVLYADHHRLIRNRGYDTVSTTPELSLTRKLSLLVRTRWKWQWNNDPERVFYEMSHGFDREHSQHGHGRHDPTALRTD
jgi:phytoene synthase